MKQTLVAVACCSRLACINSRDDDYLIGNLILHGAQAADIIKHGILSVRRAGSYHEDKFITLTRKNGFYRLVILCLFCRQLGRNRKLLLYLLRYRQFSQKLHIHNHVPLLFEFFQFISYQKAFFSRWNGASCRADLPCRLPRAAHASCEIHPQKAASVRIVPLYS